MFYECGCNVDNSFATILTKITIKNLWQQNIRVSVLFFSHLFDLHAHHPSIVCAKRIHRSFPHTRFNEDEYGSRLQKKRRVEVVSNEELSEWW